MPLSGFKGTKNNNNKVKNLNKKRKKMRGEHFTSHFFEF